MRTRVKICGITRVEDALEAVRLGVDAIGLVFYPPSPRAVSVEQAEKILQRLPPFVTVTGLFVDESPGRIEEILGRLSIDLLQFHGHEPPEACTGFRRPWIKAIRMVESTDLARLQETYASAAGLLLDTYRAGIPGGTGETFDWNLIPRESTSQIILAGGLDPHNVEQAVRRVRPYAVDVSGGVEAAKGIKDAAKMAAFIAGVKRGDYS